MDPKQLNVCLEPFPCEYNKKKQNMRLAQPTAHFLQVQQKLTTEINYRN